MTIEQMEIDSASKITRSVNAKSALESISNSSSLISGSCEIIEETTSCTNNNMIGNSWQENKYLNALDSGMEKDNSNDIHVQKSKVSGEPEVLADEVLLAESTKANAAEDDMNDVKVCDICGDVGYEEALVVCSECNEGAEHIYCMQTLLENVPEEDWFCDECKSKHKEKDQRKAAKESQSVSSVSQGTGKQAIEEDSAMKISGSVKSKLSSDKMQVLAIEEDSAMKISGSVKSKLSSDKMQVQSKRKIGDCSDSSTNKKQATERGNMLLDVSNPGLQRSNSSKVQETIRADSCGGPSQTKISVRPSYTRDGSLKVSETGKSESCAPALPSNSSSLPRSFSRENSFKTGETAKVKFLPTHTAASLCSGMALKASSKSTGVDGNSDVSSPRSGMMNSRQISSRVNPIQITDSASPVNRSGHRSSFRQPSSYSCLQSAGLSKSGDALPSFLLSSRSNNPSRGHSTIKSSKEFTSGNGQSELAGNSSGTIGNTRSNSSRVSNFSKDSQIISPRGTEMQRVFKHSSGTLPASTTAEKSKANNSAQSSNLKSESSRPDESMTLAKGKLQLASASTEKCSAVLNEVVQPQKLICEELNGSAIAKQSTDRFNKKAVDVSTDYPNILGSIENAGGMKQINGSVNICEQPCENNGNQSPSSVLLEEEPLTPFVVSTRISLRTEVRVVSDALKEGSHKMDKSLLTKEPEMSTLNKQNCKAPRPTTSEDNITTIVREDPKLSISNKNVAPGTLDNPGNEEMSPEMSTKIALDKDGGHDFSSIMHDNTPSFGLETSSVSLLNDLKNSETPQMSAAFLETKRNILPEMDHGRNDSKMKVKPTSQLMNRWISHSSMHISNEANVNNISDSYKDVFSGGGRLEKTLVPTSIPLKFHKEVLVATQSDKSMTPSSEIDVSFSPLMQTQMLSPSERTSSSAYLSNYAMGVPLQSMYGFTPQKLPTLPEPMFLWRGGFEINDEISGPQIYDGIQAHPSNKASPKVYEVSKTFPPKLLLEQVRRCDAWPKRFQESPPTDEDIALYIFPVEMERCQIQYSELLEITIERDLALRVYLEFAELLIFSSNQLPESYHRYNGRMYLWGVFRGKKTPSADPPQSFSDCHDVGSKVAHGSPSALLLKNNNPLPRELSSVNSSGCSEGEEDMDVDMEGGREIGIAERPTPRPESQIGNIPTPTMPSEHGGLSSVASGIIREAEEDMDVDMEEGREIGMAERPTPRPDPQLTNVTGSNTMQAFVVSNSKSGSCMPLEHGDLPSFASCSGSGKILGKIHEHMPRTNHVKDVERINHQSSTCDTNNELDFPPGFGLRPGFHHPPGISRNNSGKNLESMAENSNSFGVHAKLQRTRELPPALGLPKDNMQLSDRILSSGFSSCGQNCPPGSILEPEFPPGLEPVSMKPLSSSPDCPPSIKLASVKLPSPSADCLPGSETSRMKPSVPSSDRRPGLGSVSMKPLVSYAECPPGMEAASLKPGMMISDSPPGVEASKPVVTTTDCPCLIEAATVEPTVTSPECPPGLELAARNTHPFPLNSCGGPEPATRMPEQSPSDQAPVFEPHFGNSSLKPSDDPPGVESVVGKLLLPPSDSPIENLASKQLQDKPDSEVKNKVEPNTQRPYLSLQRDDRNRNHSKAGHAYSSKGVTRSHSFASLSREVDGNRNAAKMSKSKSFKEEIYYNRNISREKEDRRERDRCGSREKDCSWKRGGSSNRENEERIERSRNYSREKGGKKASSRSHCREEHPMRKWDKKHMEREYRRDREHHRDWSGYSGSRRHKDHEKHSRNFSSYRSHSESPTHSYSPSGGKCKTDAEKKRRISSLNGNSSHSESSTEYYKRPSMEKDSENGGKSVTVGHHKENYMMANDSTQAPQSEQCSLEVKEKIQNTELVKTSAENEHVLLCDLNDEAAGDCGIPDENNLGVTPVQEPKEVNLSCKASAENERILLCDLNDEATCDHGIPDDAEKLGERASQELTAQINASDLLNSKSGYASLHSRQGEQYAVSMESKLYAGPTLPIHDSVEYLQLFPVEGDHGVGESTVNAHDFSLELGLGQRSTSKEPLALLEQSSLQRHSCNFMLDNGASSSRSKPVCDDYRETNLPVGSILSLKMPRYRKEGNTWVEIMQDSELSEEADADVKLTL